MDETRVIQEVREALGGYDRRAKAWLDAYTKRGGRVHCASGCFACCDMPIRISLAEALAIGEVMTPAQHDAMRAHAAKVWDNAHAARDGDDYVRGHRANVGFCPLLDRASGRCTQYENRPARCRDTYSGLPARFCAPDGLARLTRDERRAYDREVRTNPVMDGESHFVAPLENLSVPAWERFSKAMRRELGFEVWGDFAVIVSLSRDDRFWAALRTGSPKRAIAALSRANLYHPEIVQIG